MNYLASLAKRKKKEDPFQILWEVEQAFAEADPSIMSPRTRELHELVRFCMLDAIAPWLRDEREALGRILAYADRVGEEKTSSILADALNGKPQAVKFSFALPGQESQALAVDAGEITKFGGMDWGGTDIALSLAMDGLMEAVLDDLIAASQEINLPAPSTVRRRAQSDDKIAADVSGQTALALFQKLVGARHPQMEAAEWRDEGDTESPAKVVLLPITHHTYPPASANLLSRLVQKYGEASAELRDLYAVHNGAELFQYAGECGFYLAPIEEWDALLAQAISWAEEVSWQDEKDQIPPYLYSAIAFGLTPGDSERWLFITQGEHVGKIMLSDSDLTQGQPRFDSLAQFFATLLNDAGRVLNCGGFVRYEVGDAELFPHRYVFES